MIRGFDVAVFVSRYFNPSLYLYVGVLCVAVFVSRFCRRYIVSTPFRTPIVYSRNLYLENIFNKYGVQNIKDLKTLFHYKKDDNRISEYKYRIEKLEKENLSGDLYKEENIEEIQEKIDKEKNNILN